MGIGTKIQDEKMRAISVAPYSDTRLVVYLGEDEIHQIWEEWCDGIRMPLMTLEHFREKKNMLYDGMNVFQVSEKSHLKIYLG